MQVMDFNPPVFEHGGHPRDFSGVYLCLVCHLPT